MELRSLREVIELTSKRSMPGLLELVNLYCNLAFRADYFTVLLERPEYIVEILKKLYAPEVVELIVYRVFSKPIVEFAGRGDAVELARLTVREPELFRSEVKKLLGTITQATHG
ncbi:MAG: hypothetical protein ACO2OR_02575 [Desulfurococcaceae archaeon]